MYISQRFRVARPVDEVWSYFHDIPSVVQCVPGASLLELREDGSFTGRLTVRLGPITVAFEGSASVAFKAESHTGTIEARGVDKRGGSRGATTVTFAVTAVDDGTDVAVDADISISGTAAQFARAGLVNELAGRMIREFVACLEAKLGAATASEAAAVKAEDLRALPLLVDSGAAWIKGKLRRD